MTWLNLVGFGVGLFANLGMIARVVSFVYMLM